MTSVSMERSGLKALYSNLLAAETLKNRAAALTAVCQYLSEPLNQVTLTKQTFDFNLKNVDSDINTVLTWIDVIKASLRSISIKSTATFSMTKLTMWTDFKNLILISETYGKFLSTPGFMNVLASFLLRSFEHCISHANQFRMLTPIVDLIKIVLSPVEYQAEISEKNYSDTFAVFSRLLFSLCVKQDKKYQLSVEELQFGRSSPKSCVQIVHKVLSGYPYDIYPFLEDDVFPFFHAFFEQKPKECAASGEAIQSLIQVLRANVLSATLPFTNFFCKIVPLVSEMIRSSSQSSLQPLLELVQTGIDALTFFGQESVLFASPTECLADFRSVLMDLIARLDVQPNAVYHKCGLNLVLSLDSYRVSLIRLASTLLYYLPQGNSPSLSDEADRDAQQSKRRRVATQCGWKSIFSSNIIPLPSLWLAFFHVCNYHAKLPTSLLEEICSRLLFTIKQVKNVPDMCELHATWLIACLRASCDAYRYKASSPWFGNKDALECLLNWSEVLSSRNTLLLAQTSRLLMSLVDGCSSIVHSRVLLKLFQRNITLDPFSSLAIASLMQGNEKESFANRLELCSSILATLIDYNESFISSDSANYSLKANYNQFQCDCIETALLTFVGKNKAINLKMAIPELLVCPLEIMEADEEIGILEFESEWIPPPVNRIVPSFVFSTAGDHDDSLRSTLCESIAGLISKSNFFTFPQSVRLLQLVLSLSPGHAPDLVRSICCSHLGRITDLSSSDILSLHHLKSLIIRFSTDKSFVPLQESLDTLLGTLSKRIESSSFEARSSGLLLHGSYDSEKYDAAIVIICDILGLIGSVNSVIRSEFGPRLFHCQKFRAAYALMNCPGDSSAAFLRLVLNSKLLSVSRNLYVLNMTIAILPQVLRSSFTQLAFLHFQNVIKRVRFIDSPDVVDEELPRSTRIVFFRTCCAFIEFLMNRPAEDFDPEEILLEGCADLSYSVRRFCGSQITSNLSQNYVESRFSRILFTKFFNWLSDILKDAHNLDHGRILTILKTATSLAKHINSSVQSSLSLLCQASLRSNPLGSRILAGRCLSELSLHFSSSIEAILSSDFEEIFSIFLDHNHSLTSNFINSFPLELFLPESNSSLKVLDLDEIPFDLSKGVISVLYHVDQTKGTKLLNMVLLSRSSQRVRTQIEAFLFSRALMMLRKSDKSFQECIPQNLLNFENLKSRSDTSEILHDIIQGVSCKPPYGICPDDVPKILEDLSVHLGWASVHELYLGPNSNGGTVHQLLVSFRHVFSRFRPWQSFALSNSIKAFVAITATKSFRRCLLLPGILRQFISICFWLALDFIQAAVVMDPLIAILNSIYHQDEALLKPFLFDLWSGFQKAQFAPPSWLNTMFDRKCSLLEECNLFISCQHVYSILPANLVQSIRLHRFFEVISNCNYMENAISDEIWRPILKTLAESLTVQGQQDTMAAKALGSIAVMLGQSRFEQLFHLNQSSDTVMDVAWRDRFILSHLSFCLCDRNPVIISEASLALELIASGKNTFGNLQLSFADLILPFTHVKHELKLRAPKHIDPARIPEDEEYDKWIRELSSMFSLASQDKALRSVYGLTSVDSHSAELLLPYLVVDRILALSKAKNRNESQYDMPFFHGVFNTIARLASSSSNGKQFSRSFNIALSVLRQIRHQKFVVDSFVDRHPQNASSKGLKSICYVSALQDGLNLLDFAEACLLHSRHSSAIFFLTVWAESCTTDCPNGLSSLLAGKFPSNYSKDEERFRRLYTESCKHSLDPDLLYGACASDFSEETDRLLFYHQGDWVRALQTHCSSSLLSGLAHHDTCFGIQESLRNLHCYSLLRTFTASSNPFFYEAAWNSGDWSVVIESRDSATFNESVYRVLQNLAHDQNRHAIHSDLLRAQHTLPLFTLSLNEYSAMTSLVIDQLRIITLLTHAAEVGHLPDTITEDHSAYVEGVFSALTRIQKGYDAYRLHCLKMCSNAIDIGNEYLATFLFHCARPSERHGDDGLRLDMQHARLLWLQGHHARAILNMSRLIDEADQHGNELISEGNLYIARWAADARSHDHDYVTDRFARAISVNASASGHFYFAAFQDRILKELLDKENSTEDQRFAALHTIRANELADLKHQLEKRPSTLQPDESTSKLKAYIRLVQLQFDQDEILLTRHRNKISTLAEQAVQNYLLCLQLNNQNDLQALFRLVAIWFNLYLRLPSLSLWMLNNARTVDSGKYLPLFVQLSSRLQTVDNPFPPNFDGFDSGQLFHLCIYRLVLNVLTEHPHMHGYVVIALRNLERVPVQGQKFNEVFDTNSDKQQAASNLLCTLVQQNSHLGEHIAAQLKLSEAYIELSSRSYSSKQTKIDLKNTSLGKASRDLLSLVCAPTRGLPLSFRHNYRDALERSFSIVSFDRFAEFASSGLSRPIVLSYTCADGSKHKELVKPNDDLRQDAVMEQVFHLVNNLLLHNSRASRNQLKMRTYNVVPLTPCVGLVQFIQNTQALGDYLVPAHRRYRPGDWSFDHCRSKMQSATAADEFNAYLSVTEHFHPVFHHFLHENFSDSPASWLKAQLRYTRSVAVSSMVGYVIGLGDRHYHNILIDIHDFTLVHIDFGIAFDQGKLLKKPENVPFRLTRDIVDAMGISGVEGVFRKTCELVLKVLRENQDSILTLIGVFKFDPLYRWSISSRKLKTTNQVLSTKSIDHDGLQESIPNDSNANAERACHGVKQKLEGRIGGDLLSVEGQVRKLIVDATSSANLATMFHGWAAWV